MNEEGVEVPLILWSATIAAAASLDRLDWLTGCWEIRSRESVMIECWTDGDGGLRLGVNRVVVEGEAQFFEQLRIEVRDGVPVYVASPRAEGTTAFTLSEEGDRSVSFANPEHDYPQRIAYRREGAWLWVDVSGHVDGVEVNEQSRWRRVRRSAF